MNSTTQQQAFASRVDQVPQSFIREILKVASDPGITSFAGGLPNPALFPVAELAECAAHVFNEYSSKALQYAETEGLYSLRLSIANRYKQLYNLDILPEQVLITNGSQQALDLICKLFLNPGDKVLVERPAYLGALQCFAMFEAELSEINLEEDGINTDELADVLRTGEVKLLYGVPNFQNPTGISYSSQKRQEVAEILKAYQTVFVEDDPYGELSFNEEKRMPVYSYLPGQTILLGSFSKIIAPGLRLGWMIASPEIIKKATILKQASDLHSGNITQYILDEFLNRYNLDGHINCIRAKYKRQRDIMLECLYHHFPFAVSYTRPQGGMFCWLRLPEGLSARVFLDLALKEQILFVPGDAFYAHHPDKQTLRLNFSNVEEAEMIVALEKLGKLIAERHVDSINLKT